MHVACILQDEFSDVVEEWNEQRGLALQRALEMIIYPQMIREAKSKLLEESKEHIVRVSLTLLILWSVSCSIN